MDSQAAAAPVPDGYPAQLNIERQPTYDKLRALIRCPYGFLVNIVNALLLLPHVIMLFVLYIGAILVYLVSCFAILFTGRYPRGMFDYMVGVGRWQSRVSSWSFLLSDAYPPFTFDDAAHPLSFTIEYPPDGRIPRWRGIPLLSAIVAIPVTLVGYVMVFVCALLILLPPIIPGAIQLIILFTGQYPEGLFEFVRGALRLYTRGYAYGLNLVVPYPPFTFV